MHPNLETLSKYITDKEYLKVIMALNTPPKNFSELKLVIEAYLGLQRFDHAEKLLLNWQSNLIGNLEWALWCYYYAKALVGQGNKHQALISLDFGLDFCKEDKSIHDLINSYKISIS